MVTLQPRESSAYRFEEASTALTSSGPVIPNPILVAGLGCAFGSGSACCSNTAKSAKLASPSADQFSVNTKHDVKIQNTHFVGDLNTNTMLKFYELRERVTRNQIAVHKIQ